MSCRTICLLKEILSCSHESTTWEQGGPRGYNRGPRALATWLWPAHDWLWQPSKVSGKRKVLPIAGDPRATRGGLAKDNTRDKSVSLFLCGRLCLCPHSLAL